MNDISSESANAVVDERCLSPPENGDEAAAGTERDADENVRCDMMCMRGNFRCDAATRKDYQLDYDASKEEKEDRFQCVKGADTKKINRFHM